MPTSTVIPGALSRGLGVSIRPAESVGSLFYLSLLGVVGDERQCGTLKKRYQARGHRVFHTSTVTIVTVGKCLGP
ncbi:hypothetical protein GCM10009678_04160 [Actinomadura kijaniata]